MQIANSIQKAATIYFTEVKKEKIHKIHTCFNKNYNNRTKNFIYIDFNLLHIVNFNQF